MIGLSVSCRGRILAMRWLSALVMLSAGLALAGEPMRVEMTVGEQRIMTVPGLTRVSATGTGVADVKPIGGDKFILYAQGEGRASLGVFRQGKKVQMFKRGRNDFTVAPVAGNISHNAFHVPSPGSICG